MSPNHPKDNLSLTPRRLRRNTAARGEDERVTFNPSVKANAPTRTALRIFGPEPVNQTEVEVARRGVRAPGIYGEVEVYTDGSCKDNGTDRAVAASGIWFGVGDPRNVSCRLPGTLQSNQAAEVFAIEEAARVAPVSAPLHIVSDSRFAVDGLTVHLPEWEDRDWIGVKCATLFQRAAARLRMRQAETTLRWIKGHSGDPGNDGADELAKAGLDLPSTRMPAIDVGASPFLQMGIRLERITQRLAYAGVRRGSKVQERETTSLMLERTRACLAADFDVYVTNEKLWLGLRDRDIPRKMRDFLWKMLHGAQRLGNFWASIPGYEQRALCSRCGMEDTMEHILFECTTHGQNIVWSMARAAINLTGCQTPRLSLGAVLGAPMLVVKRNGKVAKGPSRLLKILVVEGAHLIWRMRCKRVIEWEDAPDRAHSASEVRACYWQAVNKRMEMDRSLVYSRLTGRKPKRARVLETWRDVLADKEDLPENWIETPGVLVGMLGQPRPSGVG
ncbi:ribonuclease H-like protein [Polyporus arcularius HHB13444]|uniref:ribonuclease H n=1 Tax=Polyporus arcularius HHB13444 TaxID=1314778 RepID=A0A5C3PI98_9APHY|nr:ribonuclease H-like protein [Polyporus arcularius HHB13444]